MTSSSGIHLGYGDVHPFSQVELGDRASVQELLRRLLDPLAPFFSPGRARVRVPGGTAVRFDQAAAEVEGLLRPLWGLASLLEGGGDYGRAGWWVEGIRAGTDPQSPEFWDFPLDNDQRMVEMCPLGYALAVAPRIWEDLSAAERANVEAWLGNSINEKNMPNTNWLWFRVFANLGLKKNGAKFSQARLDADIEHLETFYRGDGWSNDGPEGIHQMDYYSSSYAIQFLQLLYAKLAGDEDPERAAEFKRRAQAMALDLVHYFDDEGRSIPFGRSVSYRFGMVSFWGALAYAGVELPAPLTWGMVKGIVLRHLRWWQTQPGIWSPSGTLTLGYSYPNIYLAENYNSPASPYWASLAFICLAVPAEHPFWTSEEELASSVIPRIKALKQPGHIMSYLGGHCMLLSSGQACGYPMKGTHAKYGAFAYSSAYAYSVPPGLHTLEQHALASQLGVSDDGGERWKARRQSEHAALEERPYDDDDEEEESSSSVSTAAKTTKRRRTTTPVLVSTWKPLPQVSIRTVLVPPREDSPAWHLRAHRVEVGPRAAGGRDVMTADGSFAVRNERRGTGAGGGPTMAGRALGAWDPAEGEGTSPRIVGNYDLETPEGWAGGRSGAFVVSSGAGAVGIRALEGPPGDDHEPGHGHGQERAANIVNADPNSNLVESRSVIPTLQGTVRAGTAVWYVSAVYARPPATAAANAAGGLTTPGAAGEDYLDGWDSPPRVPAWLRREMRV